MPEIRQTWNGRLSSEEDLSRVEATAGHVALTGGNVMSRGTIFSCGKLLALRQALQYQLHRPPQAQAKAAVRHARQSQNTGRVRLTQAWPAA